ncbi:MAG TPA: aminoglycoside phosphotransferase family protein [Anaeromyxobacteraceae bacterium]
MSDAVSQGDPVVAALSSAAARLVPGGRVVAVEPLGGEPRAAVGRKGAGYARPLRVTVQDREGCRRTLVARTALPDAFGHDRRADRAAELLLAFDSFASIPDHVQALDVGVLVPEGARSLADAGEPYLVTTFAEGQLYADDLRRVAREEVAQALDLARCDALARYLARLHRQRLDDPVAWRRAVRDLVGSGEGLFGVADAYPPEVPGAPAELLQRIERGALEWRWRLRPRAERLRRTHGDFHPFNVVFGDGTRFTLLDASRGAAGDAADDVTALSVNYLFFGLLAPAAWRGGLGRLWRRFWETYLDAAGSRAVLESAAPFLAWRALVLGCPRFYPDAPPAARAALLGFAARALERPVFDPTAAEALFS